MPVINAIYENGVFRPIGPVDLPDGSRVRVEPEEATPHGPAEASEGLLRIYDVLSRQYDSGTRDTAERHNEHQP